jgi:hypothetical protein
LSKVQSGQPLTQLRTRRIARGKELFVALNHMCGQWPAMKVRPHARIDRIESDQSK